MTRLTFFSVGILIELHWTVRHTFLKFQIIAKGTALTIILTWSIAGITARMTDGAAALFKILICAFGTRINTFAILKSKARFTRKTLCCISTGQTGIVTVGTDTLIQLWKFIQGTSFYAAAIIQVEWFTTGEALLVGGTGTFETASGTGHTFTLQHDSKILAWTLGHAGIV